MENDQQNNDKPVYEVPDLPREEGYNLGMMDALNWASHELHELIVHTDLKPADVRKLNRLMDSMVNDCQSHRLKEFLWKNVPTLLENERIDALVDGCEIEEAHIDK
jgi:hypothetical protein